MKNVQAYKFVSSDNPGKTTFILDFLMDDEIGMHKYYVITCGENTIVKKIASIDKVIEHFDREKFEYKELNSKQAIRILFSAMDYSLNKNEKTKGDVFEFPGVSPLNEFDKIVLSENGIIKNNFGGGSRGKK